MERAVLKAKNSAIEGAQHAGENKRPTAKRFPELAEVSVDEFEGLCC